MACKVVMCSDPCGFELKNYIKKDLLSKGYTVIDPSPDSPMEYALAAATVASAVQRGEADRGIAICGTGMGVSIICNKHRGVYAALCENIWQAARSRAVNNTNVLCLGGMVTCNHMGAEIANAWLEAEHLQGLDAELAQIVKGEFGRIVDYEDHLYANDGKNLKD